MILYPAIDLQDGRCVRLRQGRPDEAQVYNEDPAAQARTFREAGFAWLHVVDLDGAFAGGSRNGEAVRAILRATDAQVQVGGGVRDMSGVEAWLAAGVARVVLGTSAVRDPAFARQACEDFPGRIAIGVDAREGKVAIAGWAEQTELSALELAKQAEQFGAAALIVTDIGRDGLKTGVNVELVGAIADAVRAPVIASGGVRSVEDIRALKQRHGAPIAGAILGRALYDGDVTPRDALEAVSA
jgi:phosphoribosylformimino-5-aminoimidazole carboxamide ribotide isomerase